MFRKSQSQVPTLHLFGLEALDLQKANNVYVKVSVGSGDRLMEAHTTVRGGQHYPVWEDADFMFAAPKLSHLRRQRETYDRLQELGVLSLMRNDDLQPLAKADAAQAMVIRFEVMHQRRLQTDECIGCAIMSFEDLFAGRERLLRRALPLQRTIHEAEHSVAGEEDEDKGWRTSGSTAWLQRETRGGKPLPQPIQHQPTLFVCAELLCYTPPRHRTASGGMALDARGMNTLKLAIIRAGNLPLAGLTNASLMMRLSSSAGGKELSKRVELASDTADYPEIKESFLFPAWSGDDEVTVRLEMERPRRLGGKQTLHLGSTVVRAGAFEHPDHRLAREQEEARKAAAATAAAEAAAAEAGGPAAGGGGAGPDGGRPAASHGAPAPAVAPSAVEEDPFARNRRWMQLRGADPAVADLRRQLSAQRQKQKAQAQAAAGAAGTGGDDDDEEDEAAGAALEGGGQVCQLKIQAEWRADPDELAEPRLAGGYFDRHEENEADEEREARERQEQGLAPAEAGEEAGKTGGEVEKGPRTEEEKEEAKKKEEEELAKRQAIRIKPGDYQFQVHIIEARKLKGENKNGQSDPVVFVEVMGKKQSTRTFHNRTSAVWDQTLFFQFKGLSKEEVEESSVAIRVFDANTLRRNTLIGQYSFDSSYVYFQEHHEVHNQWLAITDPTNAEDKGVQGYLKVSVAVLGPGEARHIWDQEAEEAANAAEAAEGITGLVLMPPAIERKVEFLVLRCFRAEHLVAMDADDGIGGFITREGIDAYCKVQLGDDPPLTTPWVTVKGDSGTLEVEWRKKNELWIPVLQPTMTNRIRLQVWDHDFPSADDLVATATLSLADIGRQEMPPTWINLYGCQDKGARRRRVANKQNLYPGAASYYRGRLLVQAKLERSPKKSEPEVGHAKNGPLYNPAMQPRMAMYAMRALVVSGAELPRFQKNVGAAIGLSFQLGVEICIGPHRIETKLQRPRMGMCRWNEVLEPIDDLRLPADISQVPDIFVYLFRVIGRKRLNVCYARYTAKEVMERGWDEPASWVSLQKEEAVNRVADSEQPGSIMMRLGFGPVETADQSDWNDEADRAEEEKPCTIRLHLFQGRHLPPADSNGSLDPYIRAQIGGVMVQSTKKERTTAPLWYETISIDAKLPPLEFCPPLLVQLWDHDKGVFDGDDFVSDLRVSLTDPRVLHHRYSERGEEVLLDPLPEPHWWPLGSLVRTGEQGRLLIMVQRIEKDYDSTVVPVIPRSIEPPMQDWFVEVVVLGLRSLKPYRFRAIQDPCLEFDLGDRAHKASIKRTQHSKFPSGSDPNFCERVFLKARLPINSLYAPSLSMTVVDRRLGGLRMPVVGTASVSLENKIPGTPNFQPPTGSIITENLPIMEVQQEADATEAEEQAKAAMENADKAATAADQQQAAQPVPAAAGTMAMGGEDDDGSRMRRARPEESKSAEPPAPAAAGGAAAAPVSAAPAAAGQSSASSAPMHPAAAGAGDESAAAGLRPSRRRSGRSRGGGRGGGMAAVAVDGGESKSGDDAPRDPVVVGQHRAWRTMRSGVSTTAVFAQLARERAKQRQRVQRRENRRLAAALGGLGLSDADEAFGSHGAVRPLKEGEEEGGDFWEDRDEGDEALGVGDALGKMGAGAAGDGKEEGEEDEEAARKRATASKIRVGWVPDFRGLAEDDGRHLTRNLVTVDGASLLDGEDDQETKYMTNRRVYEPGLEDALATAPFETYPIMRGQVAGRGSFMGVRLPPNLKKVGFFKGLVRVIAQRSEPCPLPIKALSTPIDYAIRVYVLRGRNITPMDAGGTSDPYLKFKLGRERISARKHRIMKTTNPEFFRCYQLQTKLPGPSRLEIEVFDYDMITSDDFIGRTVIDLEDRWFEPRWQRYGVEHETLDRLRPKPLERRSLWHPASANPAGSLDVWVDILPSAMAAHYAPVKVERPPPEKFEVRVIVWKATDLNPPKNATGMQDLYFTAWIEGCRPQHTDIHWRCRRTGSFNWRLKFDVTLPMKFPYLTIQAWDQNIIKYNESLGEARVVLKPAFKQAFKVKKPVQMYENEKEKATRERIERQEKLREEKAKADKEREEAAAAAEAGDGEPEDLDDDGADVDALMGGDDPLDGEVAEFVGGAAPGVTDEDKGSGEGPEADAAASGGVEKGSGGETGGEGAGASAAAAAAVPAAQASGPDAKKKQEEAEAKKKAEEEGSQPKKTATEHLFGGIIPSSMLGTKQPAVDDGDPDAAARPKTEEDIAQEEAQYTLTRIKKMIGIEEEKDPVNSEQLQLWHKDKMSGKVWVSIEVVPKAMADKELRAGKGRSNPNEHPFLPPPTGRLNFSFNPFYLMSALLGPALAAKIGLICCVLVFVVLMALFMPIISSIADFIALVPPPASTVLWGLLGLCVCGPCCYAYCRYRCIPWCCPCCFAKKKKEKAEEGEDVEFADSDDEGGGGVRRRA